MKSKQQQSGFSLFMVMIIMLVIALLVVVTSQSSSTEMRISTNDADRKFAMSLAENGLREAENVIGLFPEAIRANNRTFTFTVDCNNGLCTPAEDAQILPGTVGYEIQTAGSNRGTVAWKRTFNNQSVFDARGRAGSSGAYRDNIRYIIEFLGERQSPPKVERHFRVTVRAKGQNENTVVILQSHVEMTN
ncbi:pilus assembly PilX family protein [Alysiella crassa]|uniref:Tfp pilus assembly protein PilX n=1 Tax=Alysiella crassa TaxID=153491 RepID=A0A376BVJ9_9NEIS|nr:PilX N-terminal domain-containing pilus assembly protein [Alysiella crassa]UOP06446.1 PilX N-terminal domain-containing pilus assembly protein [Alysiella crassa]SSY80976.1 Tfp pilus assembly protein PilX [Alysiella crassa]